MQTYECVVFVGKGNNGKTFYSVDVFSSEGRRIHRDSRTATTACSKERAVLVAMQHTINAMKEPCCLQFKSKTSINIGNTKKNEDAIAAVYSAARKKGIIVATGKI